ncbi:probable ATP-dependent RNA helicase DDX20 [Drosophila rhopaloa]|uniref:ATP-dependent RNA helicase n=1 Tax=Drosophila rhopaloa TaxID=1041015 RepID=A0A6P4FF54_DRORH|nr:probable ATP-dependent RNA helicase DDX20 [Drosophila rhopaloa]
MQREIAHNLSSGEQRSNDVAPGQVKSFEELRLSRLMMRGLKRHNFVTPTKIQAAAIPMALTNMDLLVQSKSGTGKTLIYVIAAMQGYHSKMTRPHALIVVPTRELAIQVEDTFQYLCQFYQDFKSTAFIGGTEVAKDRRRIKKSRVIIGTPGRLWHLYQNRVLDVSKLGLLVLDEADQLYQTRGLQDTVNQLIEVLPKNRQIIACSATYDQDLDVRLAKIMNKPMLISNSERATVLLGIRQFVYELPPQTNSVEEMRLKLKVLAEIFSQLPYEQAVLFASSQMRADSYKNYLAASGVECQLITGAMAQSDRLNVFEGYRNFTMRTLVTTDLMARGVDSPHANLVINLDPPHDHVTYLHRIGRAGRFGSKGIAITFISSQKESQKFKQMSHKVATAWSVLEFPKEPMPKDFNFWDFDKYNFGYFIKETNPQQEMPAKRTQPDVKANDVPNKEEVKNDLENSDVASRKQPEVLENPQLENNASNMPNNLENDTDNSQVVAKNMPEALENVNSYDQLKEAVKDKDQGKPNDNSFKDKLDLEIVPGTSKKIVSPKIKELKEVEKEMFKQDKKDALLKTSKPEEEISKDKDTAIKKPVKPKQPLTTSKLFVDALSQIEKQTTNTENQEMQLTPVITVNEYYIDNNIDESMGPTDDKENKPNNGTVTTLQTKNTINPEEMISPELTTTLTPLDLTQEPSPSTVTPPAPPANSINNKTYCLAAPTQTSSMTIQNMVISNTVDDASSISSDSMGCGYHSEKSYETIFSTSDEELIWKRLQTKKKRRQLKKVKGKRRKLLYKRRQLKKIKGKRRQLLYKLKKNHYLKAKRNLKPKLQYVHKNASLLPGNNQYYLFKKMKNRDSILKRLFNYSNDNKMTNTDNAILLDNVYLTILELFYNSDEDKKQVLESQKEDLVSLGYSPSQESLILEKPEPQNMLSVHVIHQMDIPPLPQAADEGAAGSGSDMDASEEYNEGEEDFDDDEDDDSGELNSSSGFVESNESASSGIDTSVYETNSTGEEYEYETDEESYGISHSSEEEYDDEEDDELEPFEDGVQAEEEQEEEALSNISVAGSSSQGSVEESSNDDSSDDGSNNPMLPTNNAQSQWMQTFNAQFQFIASHVASHMDNYI